MAGRAQPVGSAPSGRPPLTARVAIPGAAALALVAAATLGAALAVGLAATGLGATGAGTGFTAADGRALRFTVLQAALSALFSVALALPLARALARRRFPGRETIIALLGAPFLLPVTTAILGVVVVWGRSGWVSDGLDALGSARLDIYGLPGVLLIHIFFNLPLATRLMMDALAATPAERWRVAASLNLSPGAVFRAVEWPALRPAVTAALALVFVVCAASFAAVLALGGGPRAATLELAIYEAVAFEFDLARAARLAALQCLVSGVAAALALAFAAPPPPGPGLSETPRRWDGAGGASRALDAAVIGVVVCFLATPILAALLRGLPTLIEVDARLAAMIWPAAARSFGVALAATALCLAVALPLSALIAAARGALRQSADAAAALPLAASPFVLGVALFLALRGHVAPSDAALAVTALANGLAALPFAVRLLAPAIERAAAERGALADSLGLQGVMRRRALYAPALRRPLGLAAGLAAALSVGDLGVVALFSDPRAPTLPYLMQQLTAARRLEDAGAVGLVLTALALAMFVLFDLWGRWGSARPGAEHPAVEKETAP